MYVHFSGERYHDMGGRSTLVEIGVAKTLAEAEAIRDKEDEFENIVSEKLDLAFTELRARLKERGFYKEIDDQTLLNGMGTWLLAKRNYLFDIN
ncbi:MAG TPA: hypothetical protein VE170_00995 [Candidatus Limnocylindria bacterium]|nr:hypothetical protein [Candidatus Limnocylindria bacterium]